MKRRDLTKRIAKAAKMANVSWNIEQEGSRHTLYRLGVLLIPVPRHQELDNRLTEAIFKECEPVLGKRWWK